MSEKDDKAGWEAINNPEKLSNWMEHMRTKTSLTEAVVDGTFEDMVVEAEYELEGER